MRLPVTGPLLVALACAAPAAAQPSPAAPRIWWGDYRYVWNGGRTAGGSGVVVTYDLHLAADGCRISARGYQTDQTIRCTAVPRAGVLDIVFRSFGDGALRNQYGVAVYRPGERLFSLSNRRGTIWTGWGSYSPWEDDRPPGRHFRKVTR